MGFDELMEDLKTEVYLKGECRAALGNWETGGIEGLIKALEDHSSSVRNNAAYALARA